MPAESWGQSCLATATAALIAVPLIGKTPALGQLGLLAVLLMGLVIFETVRYADRP